MELPFHQNMCVCVCVSPYLYIQTDTHTHRALFMELICWSQMEARAVSNRAWRSLSARNGHAWQLWAHTHTHTSCLSPVLFLSLIPFCLICFTSLFYSFLLIPSSLLSASLLPAVISACSQPVRERGGWGAAESSGGRDSVDFNDALEDERRGRRGETAIGPGRDIWSFYSFRFTLHACVPALIHAYKAYSHWSTSRHTHIWHLIHFMWRTTGKSKGITRHNPLGFAATHMNTDTHLTSFKWIVSICSDED